MSGERRDLQDLNDLQDHDELNHDLQDEIHDQIHQDIHEDLDEIQPQIMNKSNLPKTDSENLHYKIKLLEEQMLEGSSEA